MDPKCYNMYPCKGGSETLEVDKWRRGDMMVEHREMQLEVKDCQRLRGQKETKKDSSTVLRGSLVLLTC